MGEQNAIIKLGPDGCTGLWCVQLDDGVGCGFDLVKFQAPVQTRVHRQDHAPHSLNVPGVAVIINVEFDGILVVKLGPDGLPNKPPNPVFGDLLLLLGVTLLQGDLLGDISQYTGRLGWGLHGFVARALLTQFPIARLLLHCRSSFIWWGGNHTANITEMHSSEDSALVMVGGRGRFIVSSDERALSNQSAGLQIAATKSYSGGVLPLWRFRSATPLDQNNRLAHLVDMEACWCCRKPQPICVLLLPAITLGHNQHAGN